MSGPLPGIPFMGCCGTNLPEFAQFRTLRVAVNDFSQTAQQNSDFAAGILDGYDMATIPNLIQRIITYNSVTSGPISTEDLNLGNLLQAGAQARMLFLSQPRIYAERILVTDGPTSLVCKVIRDSTGTITFCQSGLSLPQDATILPEITTPTARPTLVSVIFYYPGISTNTPECCTPPP